jgi:glycosyltransferase involved in cell wall biosynthesis
MHEPSHPLLTVSMPVFNAGSHLRLAVLSIINQSFKNWELIIYDDGSTDNSLESLVDIKDPRILIVNDGHNKGLAVRLNETIDMARGHYFARMDQDDVSYPDRFTKQLALLEGDHTLDVIAVSAITISESNEAMGMLPCPVSHESICAKPWQGFCFAHPTWMGKIDWFRKFRYTIPGPYFCEDQELLLRSFTESRFGGIKDVLFAYRIKEKRNLPRVIKTRWSFFSIQCRYFINVGKFTDSVLAFLVFAALVSRDVWWEFVFNINSQKPNKSIEMKIERDKWSKLINCINLS